MKIVNCVQYSSDWWLARRGVPTASCFDKIITSTGKLSTQAEGYIAELIADQVELTPNFLTEREGHTPAMRNGIALEPEARRWLAMELDKPVVEVGFITTDDGRFGCSPDALAGDDEIVELKCPMLKTHAAYVLKGVLPTDYKVQVHGQLWVCGQGENPRKRARFVSYAPGLQPLLLTVEPDDFTAKVGQALEDFWPIYQAALQKIAGREGLPLKADVAGEAKIVAILSAWQKRLEKCDDANANAALLNFNAALPELAQIPPYAKRRCWDWTVALMRDMGCSWDAAKKIFVKGGQ